VLTTVEQYASQPPQRRLERLARAAPELAAAIGGKSDAELSRRPDATTWAAKEVLCHLRDTEESFAARLETIMAMNDAKLLPTAPDRWAEERQYLRCDAGEALSAFSQRRQETLAFLMTLQGDQWQRRGLHATRGLVTIDDLLAMIAWHDDNHLDQLTRALAGRA